MTSRKSLCWHVLVAILHSAFPLVVLQALIANRLHVRRRTASHAAAHQKEKKRKEKKRKEKKRKEKKRKEKKRKEKKRKEKKRKEKNLLLTSCAVWFR